jgi:predicted HicB family RNase H-like nuclease
MATAYTIRNFPEDLHRLAKTVASWQGISLRELILKAIEEYCEGKYLTEKERR